MAKFLPDSVTYTMGKRTYRYVRASGNAKTNNAETLGKAIGYVLLAVPLALGYTVLGLGYVLLYGFYAVGYVLKGVFYVVASPFYVVRWFSNMRTKRAKKKRYQRYLQKKANKNP